MQMAFLFSQKTKRLLGMGSALALALAMPLLLPVTVSAASPGTVTITEFMANPAVVSDANGEWVEIKNATGTAVDMTGWDIDGSTITTASGSFILERNASAVICKNANRAQNDGVICDATSGFSLGNTSDTIALRDEKNATIHSLSYTDGIIQEGKSTHANLTNETAKKYSTNNFGQPAHNQTNPPSLPGTIYVSHVIDANHNHSPDFADGEVHHAGRTVRLYAVNGDNWTLKNTLQTRSTTFQFTAKFVVEPDAYALCEVATSGFTQSFTRTIVGWTTYPEVGISNLSGAGDEYNKCIPINVSSNEASSHVFGDYSNDSGAVI